jgi:hypothetical protein
MAIQHHPLNRLPYRRLDDGSVAVGGGSAPEGIFDRRGRWLCGERRVADPAMCLWVSSGYDPTARYGEALGTDD